MQIPHPFRGSIQQYCEQLADPKRYRPGRCPQCEAQHPLASHGFYHRTLVDVEFEGTIRVRRYMCRFCKHTVFVVAGVRLALPPLQCFRNRAVSHPLVC
jgi:hypothetical protein